MIHIEVLGKYGYKKELEFFKMPIDVDPLISDLAQITHSYSFIANELQLLSLEGNYNELVLVYENERPDIRKIHPDDYMGRRNFMGHGFLISFTNFIVHPLTFIRISNFWKMTQYFTIESIVYPTENKLAFQYHLWGQWLLFNRLRVGEL